MSKTRMGKRVASLLLSLVIMLSLLPTTVYAEGADGAATNDAVVEETIAPVNAEGVDAVDSQEAESSGDEVSGESGGTANVTEGEDGAATNDAVVEETIAPVNAEGVDAVANAESNGDEASGEDGTVKKDETSTAVAKIGDKEYEKLDAAIGAVADGQTIVVNAREYKLPGSQTLSMRARPLPSRLPMVRRSPSTCPLPWPCMVRRSLSRT